MSVMSSSVLLSPKEKRAISDILSQAEEEIDQTKTYKNIGAIDAHCKKVWPDWSPPKNSVPPLNISTYKHSSKSQLSSNNKLKPSISKTKAYETTLENGSPKKNKSQKQESNQTHGVKFSEHDLDPQIIAQEIESLKKDVHDLMEKINRSIKSPELSPSALEILEKVKSIQIPSSPLAGIANSQVNEKKDIPFKKEVIVSHQDVEKLILNNSNNQHNESNQQTNNNINNQQIQQPKTLFVEQFQLPLKVRTKEQTKAAISQVQREIKQITKENISLRLQYREIRKQLSESRSQCKALQSSITRSEAIRVKMINTFGIAAMTDEQDLVQKF